MCLVYVQHTACLCDLLHTDVSYLCMARYPDENASDQASRHHVGGRILKLEDGRCVCRGSVYSVAVMMFLCLLQMLLEVVWSPAVAIILLLVIQGISAYKQSVFLWGNWGIPVRMLKTPIGYIGNLRCSIAGIIVCIVIGTILFKRRDLLFKE